MLIGFTSGLLGYFIVEFFNISIIDNKYVLEVGFVCFLTSNIILKNLEHTLKFTIGNLLSGLITLLLI